jgi:hypothetical protein
MITSVCGIAPTAGVLLLLAFGPDTPPLPLSVWGTVKVNGANVAVDTPVTAWCSGLQAGTTLTQIFEGQSVYALDVNGDDPEVLGKDGCVSGETVSFRIGQQEADQTASWTSGESYELPLTAGGGARIFLPLVLR